MQSTITTKSLFGHAATHTEIQHSLAEFLADGGNIKVLKPQPAAIRSATNVDNWQTDVYLMELANLCM